MLIEIKQKMCAEDKTPGKVALLSAENIKTALNTMYPDEEFEIGIINGGRKFWVLEYLEAEFMKQKFGRAYYNKKDCDPELQHYLTHVMEIEDS